MFYTYFNNIKDRDLDVKAIKRPNIPSPIRKYKQITVEGRDGDLYIDEEVYEDIIISIDYNFVDKKDFHEKCRKIKRWLNKIQENKLSFSDDLGIYYKVKKIECDDIERTYKVLGIFSVSFTCDPYAYYKDGLDSITVYNDEGFVWLL